MRLRIAAAGLLLLPASIAVAQADVVSGGNVRVSFHGWVAPRKLPRGRPTPVALHVAGTVRPIGAGRPARLESVEIQINRHGIVSTRGLPPCPQGRLRSMSTEQALAACPRSLVGTGHFTANVEIPEEAPFPSVGRLLVFSTAQGGHRALVAQVFGTEPVPISNVLPIDVRRDPEAGFGTTLTVEMPKVKAEWGYVTGFDVTFERRYRYRGRPRSFLSASCPAPAGIAEAPFTAARGSYFLAGGRVLTRVVGGSCRVREPAA
jgi:hypothetical protein